MYRLLFKIWCLVLDCVYLVGIVSLRCVLVKGYWCFVLVWCVLVWHKVFILLYLILLYIYTYTIISYTILFCSLLLSSFPSLPSPLLPISSSSHSSFPTLVHPDLSVNSKYTCRHLDILIYVPSVSGCVLSSGFGVMFYEFWCFADIPVF